MSSWKVYRPGAAAVLAVAALGGGAAAQRDQGAGSTVNCIALNQVENTRVVDNDTILFYMRGGEVYRNDLPHACPTLESEETFMYRVTTSQLCAIDVITVLMNMGSRFMPGPSCGLGAFTRISRDEAQSLEAAAPAAAN